MFKKYLDQTGIAMAFQVIFAEILDKKIDESKLFGYTAMRLRQIGEDLEKIKMVLFDLYIEQKMMFIDCRQMDLYQTNPFRIVYL